MPTLIVECEANIKKVDLTAKIKKSQVVRLMRIKLEREFDVVLARAIGADALDILAQLKARSQEKAIIPIDSVVARLELAVQAAAGPKSDRDDKVTIPSCVGRKATASAPTENDEDLQPTVILEFEFAFSEQAWAWFGRNCGGYANVSIGEAQQKLKLARA
jgi:hypothetical protein